MNNELLYKRLIIAKFDLIRIILYKKHIGAEKLQQTREYLTYIDEKIKSLKENQNLECNNLTNVEEFTNMCK